MKVVIIGSTGTLGLALRRELLEQTDFELVNVCRHASGEDRSRERFVSADASNPSNLIGIFTGADAVFVAVTGNLPEVADTVVVAAKQTGLSKIIFTSSMGIYNEVGRLGNPEQVPAVLQPYRQAADIIEASGLDTTILRPGWFDTGLDDVVLSDKGEIFAGHDVSVQAIVRTVRQILIGEINGSGRSIGLYRP